LDPDDGGERGHVRDEVHVGADDPGVLRDAVRDAGGRVDRARSVLALVIRPFGGRSTLRPIPGRAFPLTRSTPCAGPPLRPFAARSPCAPTARRTSARPRRACSNT